MKLRKGFVSNSSSSSFIIKRSEKFKNTFGVAEYMLRQKEGKSEDCIKLLTNSKKDKDTNIIFKSCNYDTYILNVDDYFFINTCNNESWDIYSDVQIGEVMQKYPEIIDHYQEFTLPEDTNYWFLDYNLMCKETKDYDYCRTHYEDNYVIYGKKM